MARPRNTRKPPRNAPGAGPEQEIERLTPPTYDMSFARHEQARAEINDLIGRLQPGGLDSGSREVLNNLINAWTDSQLAELDAARDERLAVVDNLVALAAEQVARYKPRYDADLARVGQTGSALAATYEALTGRKPSEFVPPRPPRVNDEPIKSTLGPIDLSDDVLRADPAELPGLVGPLRFVGLPRPVTFIGEKHERAARRCPMTHPAEPGPQAPTPTARSTAAGRPGNGCPPGIRPSRCRSRHRRIHS